MRRIWQASEMGLILTLFLSTRVTLTGIGLISRALIRPLLERSAFVYSPVSWLDLWGAWDSKWYLAVATGGYSTASVGPTGERLTVFFPLYPLLIRLAARLIGDPFVAGLLVSNAALVIAAALLVRLAALDSDLETGRRAARYLFLFPTAFILSGVFTEALALMLLLAAFYAARTGRWMAAGATGFLLALTRPVGVLAAAPLAWLYLAQHGWRPRAIRWDAVGPLLPLLGLAVFSVYLLITVGDPLAFAPTDGSWGRRYGNPIAAVWWGLHAPNTHLRFGAAGALAMLLIVAAGMRRLGGPYALLAGLMLLVPLAIGPIGLRSMWRFALPVFPIYLWLAGIGRNPRADAAVSAISALLQGFLMVFWANGSLLVV
jgi:hypothetical protein